MHAQLLSTALVLQTMLIFVPTVRAQSPPPWPAAPPPHGVLVQVGLEPHLVVSVGYLWPLSSDGIVSKLGAGAGLKLSPYLLRRGAGRLNLIVAGQWEPTGPWGATGTVQPYLARSRNRAATIHGLGFEIRVAPGYHGERWSAAADLGWQSTLLSHIRLSGVARDTFDDRYPYAADAADHPVDGWYRATAHRLRVGVLATRNFGDGLGVQAGVGSLFTLQRQGIRVGFAHGQVPAYLETSVRLAR
jgi:hypothetical protein